MHGIADVPAIRETRHHGIASLRSQRCGTPRSFWTRSAPPTPSPTPPATTAVRTRSRCWPRRSTSRRPADRHRRRARARRGLRRRRRCRCCRICCPIRGSYLREHAAWALGSRTPRLDAVGRLVSGVAAGGFATVINQRALRRWAQISPDHIALALEGALLSQRRPGRPGPAGGDDGPGARRGGRPHPAPDRDRRAGAAAGPGWPRSPRSVTAVTTARRRRSGPPTGPSRRRTGAVARLAAFDLSARDLTLA